MMSRGDWVLALVCLGVASMVWISCAVGAAESDCASASLRHQANSAWAGYTCADIDDLVASSDTIKSQARNRNEKWGDLVVAFIAVILGAFSALLAQAAVRMAIALVDSLRPANDSPFYLSQFRTLSKKKDPTPADTEKLRAMSVVIAGGAVTRALMAMAFSLIYLALLTG